MKERHIGQVSFNLLDEYEVGLLAHASKKEHGRFSQYIKRLIDRDRQGNNISPFEFEPVQDLGEDVKAAKTFL